MLTLRLSRLELFVLVLFSLIVCLMIGPVWAQSVQGTITGTVRDQTGGVVPGAEITLVSLATNVTRGVVTNDEGVFRIPSVQPGLYNVTVAMPGFKTASRNEVKVDTATTLELDFQMEIGEQSTVVQVTAKGNEAVIQRADAELGQVVSQKAILDLPSPGRNTLSLALSAPGVLGEAGSENPGIYQNDADPGSGLGIGGGRLNTAVMLVDGANITGVGRNRAIMTFSPDVTQEFKVVTNNFSAEQNSFGGGYVATITKSGTNEFHGTAYWFHRQRALAARTFGTSIYKEQPAGQPLARGTCNVPGCDKAPLRRHNIGITAGGPVYIPKIYNGRNRTFFFAAFEPTRYWQGQENLMMVPDAAVRTGDFSGVKSLGKNWNPIYDQFVQDANGQLTLRSTDPNFKFSQFPNNKIPADRIAPISKKLIDLYPMPNWALDSSGRNFRSMRSVDGQDNRRSFKVDHQLYDDHTFNVRYSFNPIFAERYFFEPRKWFFLTASYFVSHNVVVNDTHTFSPNMFNNFIYNWNWSDFSTDFPTDWKNNSAAAELGLETMYPNYGTPRINTGFGTNVFNDATNVLQKREGAFNLSDTFSVLRGNHSFRLGGTLLHQYLKSTGDLYEFYKLTGGLWGFGAGQTTMQLDGKGGGGETAAAFLLGVPGSVQMRSDQVDYAYRWKSYSGFFQDDWKASRNLTLNLGVRYDIFIPRTEDNYYQMYLDYENPVTYKLADGTDKLGFRSYYAGMGEARSYLEKLQKANFAPRLGLAWSPNYGGGGILGALFGPGKGVIRAGYGVVYVGRTGLSDKASPTLKRISDTTGYKDGRGKFGDKLLRIGLNNPSYHPDPASISVPDSGFREPWDPYYKAGNAYDQDALAPLTHSWNFSMQFPVGATTAVTFAYIGNRGVNLPTPIFPSNIPALADMQAYWANGINPTTEMRDNLLGLKDSKGVVIKESLYEQLKPYYAAGDLSIYGRNDSFSNYQSFQFRLERRFASGMQFNLNYTLSKSLDNASDANEVGATGSTPVSEAYATSFQWYENRDLEKSLSNYDQTHLLNYYFIAELPFGAGKPIFSENRLMGAILGGWQVTGNGRVATGVPYAINLGDNNGLPWYSGRLTVRPNIVPGVPLVNPAWNKGNYWDVPYVNPAAFSRPAFGQLGNAPRTFGDLRFPRKTTLDVSLQRIFRPFKDETKYFQLRAEAFNVLNHPLFNMQGKSVSVFGSGMGTKVNLQNPNAYAGPIKDYWGPDDPNWNAYEKDMNANVNNDWGKIYAVDPSGREIQLALKIFW